MINALNNVLKKIDWKSYQQKIHKLTHKKTKKKYLISIKWLLKCYKTYVTKAKAVEYQTNFA